LRVARWGKGTGFQLRSNFGSPADVPVAGAGQGAGDGLALSFTPSLKAEFGETFSPGLNELRSDFQNPGGGFLNTNNFLHFLSKTFKENNIFKIKR